MISNKLLMTFLFLFVGISILGAIMQGGGGIVSTVLADDISANATYVPATSTSLFANKDIIAIGGEKILYTSKNATGFTVQTRGYSGTTAAAHEAGRRIYTEQAGVLNEALGFNLQVELQSSGVWGVLTLLSLFFTDTLPHLIVLNANFLRTPELAIIGFFWFAFGIALLVTIAFAVAPIAIALVGGVAGLFRR